MKRVSSCILLVLVRLLLLLVFFSQPTLAVQGEEETEMMQNLLMQVQTLRTELESMRAELSDHRLKREQLEERVAELQSGKTDAPASGASSINQAPADSPSPLIDLQPQEYASITQMTSSTC